MSNNFTKIDHYGQNILETAGEFRNNIVKIRISRSSLGRKYSILTLKTDEIRFDLFATAPDLATAKEIAKRHFFI